MGGRQAVRVARENVQLRSILKQFLDGVSVNEEGTYVYKHVHVQV